MSKCLGIDEYEALLRKYDPAGYVSPPFLTKYEMTSIKGMRLQQLYDGAPSVLAPEELKGLAGPEEILEREIATRKVPVMLLRTLAGGERELWRLEDLRLPGEGPARVGVRRRARGDGGAGEGGRADGEGVEAAGVDE